ncbi:hypothetical protein EYZ11_001151 [Aspergillus tanneri]|uniref:F-box domain-containing protein n=1 Tax=Aspergillus tanneri TaxID=1220188 RepID=A0A4S3JV81_9EURO|nr:uncharacterized protein ATNIH1004_002588 [Aspergillus tanneri]KAA8649909.1 hypothetical protein ATNIH1004_002588 [Aspergillus tanneri]THC99339.1 hypothetical protein EYZ11_001151 [Aspergillus tanneri]
MNVKFSNFQSQSPLFSILPAELRTQVFSYVLSDSLDITHPYSKDTFYTRPGYTAPILSHTSLLRTCKRAYHEAWFIPFVCAEHTFYLSSEVRSPGRLAPKDLQQTLDTMHEQHGKVEVNRIRVFAQLYALEPGNRLQSILDMDHFYPRHVTLTIRYTDFWYWENCEPLYIKAAWVNRVRFPDSVTRFTMEFESIERRKNEINYIASEAVGRWFFTRRDGRVLTAKKEDMTVSKWTGSSTLSEQRWLRDEVHPGQLDYHVVTVRWRVASDDEASKVDRDTPRKDLAVPEGFLQPPPSFTTMVSVWQKDLERANVPADLPAEEVVRVIDELHAADQLRVRQRRSIRTPRIR